jgi:glycosyltransferase involved in cell wall biosynthesis
MFRGSKGHPQLLQAFAQLREKRLSASLLLVGDGIRRAWVQQLAQAAGLAESVVFTGFRPDVPALLATMDCFVLASTRTEGVPQALLQARDRRPGWASNGGIPEVTGGDWPPRGERLVPALVAAIGRVLDDPRPARRARPARSSRRTSPTRADRPAPPSYEELPRSAERPLTVLHLANRWWTGSAEPVIRR